jgi:hypothetical protein
MRAWSAFGIAPVFLIGAPSGSAARARARPEPAPAQFVVIVNAANPADTVGRDDLAKFFLKRSVTWPSGKHVEPLDLPIDDPIRALFAKRVLHKTLVAVRAFWEQQIFSGRDVPPYERPSDAEVIATVSSAPGAVGYVTATIPLPAGVKTVVIRGLDDQ